MGEGSGGGGSGLAGKRKEGEASYVREDFEYGRIEKVDSFGADSGSNLPEDWEPEVGYEERRMKDDREKSINSGTMACLLEEDQRMLDEKTERLRIEKGKGKVLDVTMKPNWADEEEDSSLPMDRIPPPSSDPLISLPESGNSVINETREESMVMVTLPTLTEVTVDITSKKEGLIAKKLGTSLSKMATRRSVRKNGKPDNDGPENEGEKSMLKKAEELSMKKNLERTTLARKRGNLNYAFDSMSNDFLTSLSLACGLSLGNSQTEISENIFGIQNLEIERTNAYHDKLSVEVEKQGKKASKKKAEKKKKVKVKNKKK